MTTPIPLPPIPARIEDYALLADCNTAALVSRAGSIDWLCWPRFDSGACLAALLGDQRHGRWQICPATPLHRITRHYHDGSTILETLFHTQTGSVALIDFMPMHAPNTSLIRIVEGRTGTVAMQFRLRLRFDYGQSIPWVTELDEPGIPGINGIHGITAIAGPDLVVLRGDIPTKGQDLETVADFTITAGHHTRFVLSHGPSHLPLPAPLDPYAELARTGTIWRGWSDRCDAAPANALPSTHQALVKRALITLKALTYTPTGGIVAAPTTSLPERIGGDRNWDYRFCWLRDSTLTLIALMNAGFYDEAQAWGDWLHRAIAGSATQLQIMYGLAGERRLDERTLDWLPGYEGSAPVRIGNQAASQLQLDVFGEVMGSMRQIRLAGLKLPQATWALQCNLLDHLATLWPLPDCGMWESRGPKAHYTLSKVMAWLAFDCAIRDAEQFDLDGELDAWRDHRDQIHALVCAQGFDPARNTFVQAFGAPRLDASLLLIPLTGFVEPTDPRMVGTVAAIQAGLMHHGLVRRYEPDGSDGLTGDEGVFLACSFWLVNCLALQDRAPEAQALFDHLLTLANDVGLMAEEYDPIARRQVGNFPQAFSHLALATSARILAGNHPAPAPQP